MQLNFRRIAKGLQDWLQEERNTATKCKKESDISKCAPGGGVSIPIDQELKLRRIALVGSQEIAQQLGVHVNPFGVIPKKGKPNKWRLILDLSAPTGGSVNDGISKEECSLQYTSVSEVAAKCVQLGAGTLMGKMDIQQAYRNVPVAPEDRRLLGMKMAG